MGVLKGQHPRTAADDEPTSRADKARGISPNKYIISAQTACYLLKGKKAESGTHSY